MYTLWIVPCGFCHLLRTRLVARSGGNVAVEEMRLGTYSVELRIVGHQPDRFVQVDHRSIEIPRFDPVVPA